MDRGVFSSHSRYHLPKKSVLPESENEDSLIPQSTPEQTREKTSIIRSLMKLRLTILTNPSFHRVTKPNTTHLSHTCPYTPNRRCRGVGWGQPLTDPSPGTIPLICSSFPVLVTSWPSPFKHIKVWTQDVKCVSLSRFDKNDLGQRRSWKLLRPFSRWFRKTYF